MLTNEFQSMIEQYSNDLMSISKNADKQQPCEPNVAPPVNMPQIDPAQSSIIESDNKPNENEGFIDALQNGSQVSPLPETSMCPNSEQPQNSYRPSDLMESENTRQPVNIPNNNGNNAGNHAVNNAQPVNNANAMRDNLTDDSESMTYEQFLLSNPDSGLLKVQVFSGNQVSPISGAEVIVSKDFVDGKQIFFQGLTDISGIVDNIELPAPSKSMSESPRPRGNGEKMPLPYSQYNITVQERMYVDQEYTHVPIFSGIKSIQPVRLTPLQFGNGNQNGTIVFPESEPNDL